MPTDDGSVRNYTHLGYEISKNKDCPKRNLVEREQFNNVLPRRERINAFACSTEDKSKRQRFTRDP